MEHTKLKQVCSGEKVTISISYFIWIFIFTTFIFISLIQVYIYGIQEQFFLTFNSSSVGIRNSKYV